MRPTIAAVLLFAAASLAACGPRQVEVRTAPTQTAEVAIHFTNNLSKAVNVYVNTGGSDLFVRQVAANTTEHLPVPGISAGTSATLKATPVDGSAGYMKTGVTMTDMTTWRVP
jgi:predicted polyphosphate/ATP-dependent NAD kinase